MHNLLLVLTHFAWLAWQILWGTSIPANCVKFNGMNSTALAYLRLTTVDLLIMGLRAASYLTEGRGELWIPTLPKSLLKNASDQEITILHILPIWLPKCVRINIGLPCVFCIYSVVHILSHRYLDRDLHKCPTNTCCIWVKAVLYGTS